MTSQPFFVPALLFCIVAIPLVLGLIPRNRIYGIRTAKTLSDEWVWSRSNRFGGWAVLFSSVIYLLVAKFYPTLGPRDVHFSRWLVHFGAFLLPLIVSLILIRRYTRNL